MRNYEGLGKSRRRGVFWDFKYWFERRGDCSDVSTHEGRKGVLGVGVQWLWFGRMTVAFGIREELGDGIGRSLTAIQKEFTYSHSILQNECR